MRPFFQLLYLNLLLMNIVDRKQITQSVLLMALTKIWEQGFNLSRTATYYRIVPAIVLYLLPNANNGKRHVYTVPAKLCRPQNDLRKKHSYSYFAMALVKIARELEKLFGTILFFLVPR